MKSGLDTGMGKLLMLTIIVVTIYVAFFGFDVTKAYNYTILQLHTYY